MDSLDLFYRGFLKYKQVLKDDAFSLPLFRYAQALNKLEHENLTVTYYACTIEEDWILALEKALPFIEKAIKEDRQFIRNDQDVLPIEKVRKTSRQSIQDLSKRSDYITRKPDQRNPSDITPDKLMIIRKENDYAVYENKVLFTTVLYAKEFVESRLTVIKEATTKYEAKTHLKKTLDTGLRILELDLNLHEIRKNDAYAMERSQVQALVQRIEAIFSMLLAFMKMPLLAKLTQADMVKRPITKTNVLKMNLNFKNTLGLFDYLVDYNQPGYMLKRIDESLFPLSSQTMDDYTHVALLLSFVTYQYGNHLSETLSERYFAEEARRQQEKEAQLLEQLKKIHLTIELSGKTLDQYLVMFEEGYRVIERRVELLKQEIKDQKLAHLKELSDLTIKHDQAILQLKEIHEQVLVELKQTHQEEQRAMEKLHQTQLDALQLSHQNDLKQLETTHQQRMLRLTNSHEEAMNQLQARLDKQVQEMSKWLQEKDAVIEQKETALQETIVKHNEAMENLQVDRDLLKGELIVLQQQHGLPIHTDDFTSKARFLELERIKDAYQKFFSKSWQATKRAIRQELLGTPPVRKETSDEEKTSK